MLDGGCADKSSAPGPKAKKSKATGSAKRASGPGNAEEAKRLRDKLGEGSRLLLAQSSRCYEDLADPSVSLAALHSLTSN